MLNDETKHLRRRTSVDDSRHQAMVLLVEDESPIAEALTLIIEDAGYTAITASHGNEALELMREFQPSLIITDLMMPYLNGVEFIAALRTDAAASGEALPPIVLMTAAGPARIRDVEADAVLRKPFDLREIDALLQRFLGSRDHGK